MGFGGSNWGDPNSMALMGMAQALGQAAMPSRLPVPNGAVFGAMAGGLMQGAKSGYDMKQEQMKTLLYEAQAAEAKRKAEVLGQVPGMFSNLEKMFGGTPGDGTTASPAQYAPSDTTDPGVVPDINAQPPGRLRAGKISDPRGVEPLIRAAAIKYGHDPDIAVRVAQTEGLATFLGDGGKSGTAFQLYTGGGLGNEFQKETGLSPLDPKNEPAAIDWAMKNLERTGWKPYHGAARFAGIGDRDGIGVGRQANLAAAPVMARGADGGLTRNGAEPDTAIAGMPAWLVGSSPGGSEKWLNQTSPRGWLPSAAAGQQAGLPIPPALNAALANASRPAPMNNITPLASGAAPVGTAAPLSLAPGMSPAARGPILSPQALALAKAGAMSQLVGLGDIVKPWATAYYNSPAQKAEVEAATTHARETAGLRFIAPKKTLERGAAEPFDNRAALLKADLDARNAAIKAAQDLANADLLAGRMPGHGGRMIARPGQAEVDAAKKGAEAKAEADARASVDPQTIVVTLPDGSQVERQVTKKQYAEMVAGAPPVAAAPGQGLVPGGAAPGSPAYGKPVGMGQIPDGYRLIIPPEGGPARLERVPGSPGAQAAEQQEGAKQQAADIVTQDIQGALQLSGTLTTGFGGALLKGIPGTPAFDVRAKLDTIKANVGFDRLQTMRSGSPTGGALGPVSDVENHLLQSTLGNLEQSQSREQFEKNLRRLHEVYQDIVHGAPADLQKAVKEGKLPKVQYDAVMERRKKARESIELKPITPDIKADVDGAIARGAPRDAVIQRLRDRGYDTSQF